MMVVGGMIARANNACRERSTERAAAYLALSLDAAQRLTGEGVPETDASIRSAPTTGQKAVLMGGPGDCLDSREVLLVGKNG